MKTKKLHKLVNATLLELDSESELHHTGAGGVSSLKQLQKFKLNLLSISDEVRYGVLIGQQFDMSRAIVDSWPFNSKLGELIIAVEEEYKKLT